MNEIELKQRFPRASRSFINANLGIRPEADKPITRPALERPVAGKEKVSTRVGLSYVLYRIRLFDPDSIDQATKVCTDVLCQAGLIPGDGPNDINLTVTQEKVKHRYEQRTQITIRYP